MAIKTNFEVNGHKYNRKTITVGYDKNGIGVQKQFYGRTEKEVKEKIDTYLNIIKTGTPADFEKVTFEQLFNVWLWDILFKDGSFKATSFEKKEGNYRNYIIKSDIIHLTVYNTSSLAIQKWYNDLYDSGVKTSKIFDINKTMRSFCSWCVNEHYMKVNICSLGKVKIPGDADQMIDFDSTDDEDLWNESAEGNNIIIFNEEEKKIIFDNLKYIDGQDNTLIVSILLDFCTGLRKGEILGLRNGLLNTNLCKLKVKKALGNLKIFLNKNEYTRELKLKNPKSKSSVRIVDYVEDINSILIKYKKEQEQKWSKNGLEFTDTSLLFTTSSCKPIDPTNYYRAYIRFLNRIGVRQRKYHAIRDTCCTDMFRSGATILEVRDIMGHSSIEITEKFYLFVFPQNRKKVSNLLSCYFK